MSETSVLELIGQLCDIYLGPAPRAFRVQPTVSRIDIKKKLKKKAYDALFGVLKNRSIDHECPEAQIRKDAKGILLEVYKLRLKQQWKDADRLENLFNQLRKDDNGDIQQYMTFIVALKGSGGTQITDNLTDGVFNIPETKEPRKNQDVLPARSIYCKDVTPFDGCSHYYMHYPKEVFESPFTNILKMDEKNMLTTFDVSPGTGLGSDCFFTNKFLLGDMFEQTTHKTLFGGLMQGKVDDLSTQLTFPDLSSVFNIRIPEFKCKRSLSSSWMSDESGLGSGSASMSSSDITLSEYAGYDDSIWESALTEPRSKHYTWEWIGYLPGPTERPYLTEAGPDVFDIVIKLRQRASAILCSESKSAPLVTVQSNILVKHTLLMLIGVSSNLFPFCQETQRFQIVDGLHVNGISSEMLTNFLSEFVECGTFFSRLSSFSQPPVLNSFYTAGLIFQAFTRAIRKFLSHFTAAVLKIPHSLPLLNLKVYLLKAMEQIRYVATLCRCHDNSPPVVAPGNFPIGMKLLSYLYEETEVSSSSSHYPLLLSILQTSFAPFVLFIRDWVFYGVYRDFFGEFMIQVDLSCIEMKDETYWSNAYTLMSEGSDGEMIPHFLRDSIRDIVTCGKSINFLRICNPQHFMCNVSECDIPTLSITFSYDNLRATEKHCQIYVGRMMEIAQQHSLDRQDVLRKVEQERIEFQQMARRVADHEIARLQGVIDDKKRKAQKKKQTEFNRLKEQMETDLKRRADEKGQAKDEDKQFIARMNREEHALAEEEIELEKKVRDQLIEYYTDLGEEALHRERLALWRVRRSQLESSRLRFLEADAERWRREMTEHLQAEDLLDSTSQNLPNWAVKSSTKVIPIIVSDEEVNILPTWAKHESFDDVLKPDLFDNSVELPKWALRDTQAVDAGTIEVVDDLRELDDDDDGGANVVNDEETGNQTSKEFANVEDSDNAESHKQFVSVSPAAEFSDVVAASKNIETALETHAQSETALERHIQSEISLESQTQSRTTLESHAQSDTRNLQRRNVTEQSEECTTTKSHIKFVPGKNSLTESQETQEVRHVKNSSTMFASKESDPDTNEHKPHLKSLYGLHVTDESSQERQMIPRRQKNQMSQFASRETESKEWIIKKSSIFGHISQLSNANYVFGIPKLKKHSHRHASLESDFKDFTIKSCIRMRKNMSASKESEESSTSVQTRTHIRVFAHRNASSESERTDENAISIQRFKSHNVWGHSSDSTVQRLLYGNLKSVSEDEPDGPIERIELQPGTSYQIEPYQTEFEELDKEPLLDLMAHISVVDLGRGLVDAVVTSEEEVEAYKYTPLSVLLNRSIMAPIRAQVSLVNGALINYFTSELKVDGHLEAIRRYLLMADGDFAEILSNILLEKMFKNPKPQEILNPVFLNGALNKAIRSSIHSNDENAQNLSFALKYMPSVFLPNAPKSLNCLELRYNVSWPLNIILTNACMKKYYLVFTFLLQIKRVVWTLKDVWHRLKRDAIINKVGNATQFRHLQLHRQEMEHFVKMMQGYITNQVILVSWQEFQTALNQPIAGLDQLHALHEHYVDKVIFRCLLDKKAEKVMKIIQDIFTLILKFRSQLVSSCWQRNEAGGEVTHQGYVNMVNTYKSFHVYSFFLFKVVNRLSQKGYQPHLQELLLQLNFNDYYTEAAN